MSLDKEKVKESKYVEIDIIAILRSLWKRAWLIVIATIVFGGAAFSYANFFVTPKYQSSAMMYVNNNSVSVGSTSFSISSSDLTAAQSLVNTYMVILNSRTVLNEVIDEADLNYSYNGLKSMITAAPVNSTEVFEVIVESPSPQESEKIANCICAVLPEKIADVIESSSVKIVDYAVVPNHKASPSVTKYTMIGMIIGYFASCLVILIIYLFDQYIRSEEYLLQNFNHPVLAVIPDLDDGDKKNYRYYAHAKGSGYE